jgi:hypothetical protein
MSEDLFGERFHLGIIQLSNWFRPWSVIKLHIIENNFRVWNILSDISLVAVSHTDWPFSHKQFSYFALNSLRSKRGHIQTDNVCWFQISCYSVILIHDRNLFLIQHRWTVTSWVISWFPLDCRGSIASIVVGRLSWMVCEILELFSLDLFKVLSQNLHGEAE